MRTILFSDNGLTMFCSWHPVPDSRKDHPHGQSRRLYFGSGQFGTNSDGCTNWIHLDHSRQHEQLLSGQFSSPDYGVIELICCPRVQVLGPTAQFRPQCGSQPTGDVRIQAGAIFNHTQPCALILPPALNLLVTAPSLITLASGCDLVSKGSMAFGSGGADAIMLNIPHGASLNVSGSFTTETSISKYTQIHGTGTMNLLPGSSIAPGGRFNLEFLQAGKMIWTAGTVFTSTSLTANTLLGPGQCWFSSALCCQPNR